MLFLHRIHLPTVRDGWFMNLSSFDIPYNIQCFLQFGKNFALSFNNKNKIIFDCIKSVERSTQRMPIDKRIEVTNHSIPILNIISSPIFTSPIDKQLLKLESDTCKFILAHPNIIFTHADKGNVTAVMRGDKNSSALVNFMRMQKMTWQLDVPMMEHTEQYGIRVLLLYI